MNYNKPKWWVLYTLLPLMIVGIYLIQSSAFAAFLKSLGDIALIIFTFGGMALWMHLNDGAITRSEYAQTERARMKRHRHVRSPRSGTILAPKPTQKVPDAQPLSGFGSARL